MIPRQSLPHNKSTAAGFIALVSVLALLVASTSVFFGGISPVIIGLSTGVVFIGGYLVWKGLIRRETLPKSGFELPLAACMIGLVISLALSKNPRVGLERTAQLIVLGIIFYLLLDVFQSGETRAKFRVAFIAVSGLLMLAALLETYSWYRYWWSEVGSWRIMPPFQFRFTSLAIHPSFFMMIANLCAPLAVVTLLKTRSRAARFGCLFWLVLYIMAIPFSSSRAGWLGAGAWVFTLLVLWFSRKANRAAFIQLVKRLGLKVVIPAAAISGIALLVALLLFYRVFAASNPAHGSGNSINREMIWGSALALFKSSPWVGVGPGQATQNLLPASKQSPFGFWPVHAHSTPLQILAEFGLAGFVPLLLLLAMGLYRIYRSLGTVSDSERAWLWTAIAAFAAITVQGVFDDVTYSIFPLGIIVFYAASVCSLQKPARFPKFRMAWLVLPALVAASVAVFNIWVYLPSDQVKAPANTEDWTAIAQTIEQRARRDPLRPEAWNQAGLAWARAWQETGDTNALAAARRLFAGEASLDAGNSLVWANLAVLNWQAGLPEQALADIQKAVELSPGEAYYHLNYAAFLEGSGKSDEAVAQYAQVLALRPEVISHPFWHSSPVRERSLQQARGSVSDETIVPYWALARTALENNDAADARWNLALSGLYLEASPAWAAGWAAYAKQAESAGEYRARLEEVFFRMESLYWGIFDNPPEKHPSAVSHDVVPGFLKINADGGQFEALTALLALQKSEGDCPSAARTWNVLQRDLRAGEWTSRGYPPVPGCP